MFKQFNNFSEPHLQFLLTSVAAWPWCHIKPGPPLAYTEKAGHTKEPDSSASPGRPSSAQLLDKNGQVLMTAVHGNITWCGIKHTSCFLLPQLVSPNLDALTVLARNKVLLSCTTKFHNWLICFALMDLYLNKGIAWISLTRYVVQGRTFPQTVSGSL